MGTYAGAHMAKTLDFTCTTCVFAYAIFVFQLCTDGANPEVLCLKGHILLKLNRADEVEVIILQGKIRIIIKNNSCR